MTTPTAAAAGTIEVAGRTVNRMGYGAMRLCGPDILGPPDDPAEAREVLRRAVALEAEESGRPLVAVDGPLALV